MTYTPEDVHRLVEAVKELLNDTPNYKIVPPTLSSLEKLTNALASFEQKTCKPVTLNEAEGRTRNNTNSPHSIDGLEEILNEEEDVPVEILPSGEIRTKATKTSSGRKPLTFKENLGGEYREKYLNAPHAKARER